MLPQDFVVTPTSLNILYLCDGKLHKSDAISLCVESFDKNTIENILIDQISKIGINCWIDKRNRVYVSSSHKDKFLNFIGSCPINCYKHKWDRSFCTTEHRVWIDRIRNGSKTKLSYDNASTIRHKYLTGKVGILDLAKEYNVNDKTIRDVIYNRSWPDNNYNPIVAKNIANHKRYKSNVKTRSHWHEVR